MAKALYEIKIGNDAAIREQAYAVRRKVFIEEQHVPEELEMDGYDIEASTCHLLVSDQTGCVIATARFRPYGDGLLKVERVAVLADRRGRGIGRQMMLAVEGEALAYGCRELMLSAQLHAQHFYEHLGYEAQGAVYQEAGMEHVDMVKRLTDQ